MAGTGPLERLRPQVQGSAPLEETMKRRAPDCLLKRLKKIWKVRVELAREEKRIVEQLRETHKNPKEER